MALSDISLITQASQQNPLQGLTNTFNKYGAMQEKQKLDERADQQNMLDTQMKQEKLISSKLENMTSRDKARLSSVVQASAELNGYLEAGDTGGAESFLTNRRKELGQRIANGEQVDTTETDQALQMLKENPDKLKSVTQQGIKLGQMAGILKTTKEMTPLGGGNGGVVGQLADRLKAGNPNMTDEEAIYLAQTGMRQGTTMQGGQIMPLGGAPDARGAIKYGEKAGQERAELDFTAPKATATALGKAQGEAKGKAIIDLPNVEGSSNEALKQIDEMLTHKGLAAAVGLSSYAPTIAGSDAADFESRLDQLKGKAFLEAFNSLKGGGQITEIEGEKATNAMARLQLKQSEKEFKKSLGDLKSVINKGLERAKSKAGNQTAPDPRGIPLDGVPPLDESQLYEQTPSGVKYRVVQ